jgi:hypothetical protein
MSKNSAIVLFKQIETVGSLVVQGYSAVQTLREAIQFAMRETGYHITFEPGSDPELVDYLTVAGTSGVEWAAGGAVVGTLLGLLCERPGVGAAIGMGLGAAVGVAQGIHRVEQGWRIRAIHVGHRIPQVTIHAVR